jgi:hypothetical protein
LRPDARYRRLVDGDRDGIVELKVRFDFDRVDRYLRPGLQQVLLLGRTNETEIQGTGTIQVLPLGAYLHATLRDGPRSCRGVLAVLRFSSGVPAAAVDRGSLRLNGEVQIERVLRVEGNELTVSFGRLPGIAHAPPDGLIEVRVTGTLQGVPFLAKDRVRVNQ